MWPHASCRLTHTSRPYVTMCLWCLWGIKRNEFCILNRVIKAYLSSLFLLQTKRSILKFKANILAGLLFWRVVFLTYSESLAFCLLCFGYPNRGLFFYEQNIPYVLSGCHSNALLRVLTQRFYMESWNMRIPHIHMLLSPHGIYSKYWYTPPSQNKITNTSYAFQQSRYMLK